MHVFCEIEKHLQKVCSPLNISHKKKGWEVVEPSTDPVCYIWSHFSYTSLREGVGLGVAVKLAMIDFYHLQEFRSIRECFPVLPSHLQSHPNSRGTFILVSVTLEHRQFCIGQYIFFIFPSHFFSEIFRSMKYGMTSVGKICLMI